MFNKKSKVSFSCYLKSIKNINLGYLCKINPNYISIYPSYEGLSKELSC